MNTIETWEALDRAIAVAAILAEHRVRLEEFRGDFELREIARFVILEPGEAIELPAPPEYVTEHKGVSETVCLVSDSFGWVVITPT